MRKMRLFLLLLLSTCCCLTSLAEKGDNWRVSDQDLTVWDSPDYQNKLGMVHRGYTFEEEAMDGDMVQFLYNGQKAYVATYCCEKISEKIEAKEPMQEMTATKQTKISDSSTIDSIPTSMATDSQDDGYSALLAIPFLILGLVGACISLVAFLFTFCYVFKYQALANWFNKKCGVAVIPNKRLNKLLLTPVLAAFATVLTAGVAFGVAGMVEENSNSQIALMVLAAVLFISTPIGILGYFYTKHKNQYGKRAARWMMVYSLLSIVAIYLVCILLMYLVIGIVALLVIALIICLAFPTRYYLVRRW